MLTKRKDLQVDTRIRFFIFKVDFLEALVKSCFKFNYSAGNEQKKIKMIFCHIDQQLRRKFLNGF